MARSPLAVTVRRRYDVAPDVVFRAFTEPALLGRWFSPSADVPIEVVAHDLRIGGHYRFRYTEPGAPSVVVAGAFCEISHPTRLVFTWTWEAPDPHAGIETLVTVDFVAEGTGTLVVVTHERFPDPQIRDRHDAGWRGTLARLPGVVGSEST
jgi:uncharacterized protein YndB with AHSA1/START domain